MQFIDHLGTDALDICDDNGTSLFHYAVGCLDDSAILKLMEKGASLMNRTKIMIIYIQNKCHIPGQIVRSVKQIIFFKYSFAKFKKDGYSKYLH